MLILTSVFYKLASMLPLSAPGVQFWYLLTSQGAERSQICGPHKMVICKLFNCRVATFLDVVRIQQSRQHSDKCGLHMQLVRHCHHLAQAAGPSHNHSGPAEPIFPKMQSSQPGQGRGSQKYECQIGPSRAASKFARVLLGSAIWHFERAEPFPISLRCAIVILNRHGQTRGWSVEMSVDLFPWSIQGRKVKHKKSLCMGTR